MDARFHGHDNLTFLLNHNTNITVMTNKIK
jgi:hypothetical protein